MFHITNFDSERSGIHFKVNYQFPNRDEQHETHISCMTKKDAAFKASQLAFDFLKACMEQFIATIDSVKPHYFDQSVKPYIRNGNAFCNAYWRFLGITEKSKQLHTNSLEYAKYLKEKLPTLGGLIPDLTDLKRVAIREQLKEMIEVAKNLETFISRYQNHSLLKIAV